MNDPLSKREQVRLAALEAQTGSQRGWHNFINLIQRDIDAIAKKNCYGSDYEWEDFSLDIQEAIVRQLPNTPIHAEWDYSLWLVGFPRQNARNKRGEWLFGMGISQDEYSNLGIDDALELSYAERCELSKKDLNILREAKRAELGKNESIRVRSEAISAAAGLFSQSDLTDESNVIGIPDENDNFENWYASLDYLSPAEQYLVITVFELGASQPVIEIGAELAERRVATIKDGKKVWELKSVLSSPASAKTAKASTLEYAAKKLGMNPQKAKAMLDRALIKVAENRYSVSPEELARVRAKNSRNVIFEQPFYVEARSIMARYNTGTVAVAA